eukprot:jgi/Picre1/32343/NNA_007689.t1
MTEEAQELTKPDFQVVSKTSAESTIVEGPPKAIKPSKILKRHSSSREKITSNDVEHTTSAVPLDRSESPLMGKETDLSDISDVPKSSSEFEEAYSGEITRNAIPPSLQGLSLHPISFGENEPSFNDNLQTDSDSAYSFSKTEHPPGLFSSMPNGDGQGPQQPLMTFGSDAGKMHTGGLGLLLGGLDTINTAERNASHALQFGDILLPSTIDGCVDPESSLQTQQSINQIKGGSGKSRAHRPHSRGRGRRGRDSKNKK